MLEFADHLDKLNERFGRFLALTPLALMLVQFSIVLAVYVFGTGSIMMQESLQYINAMMFLGGAGYTALHDDHVRVDIFYSRMRPKNRDVANLFGTVFFLIPMLVLLWILTIPYVAESWRIGEGSIETSGLHFVYLLKSTILLFCGTLSLFAIAQTIRLTLKLFFKRKTS